MAEKTNKLHVGERPELYSPLLRCRVTAYLNVFISIGSPSSLTLCPAMLNHDDAARLFEHPKCFAKRAA